MKNILLLLVAAAMIQLNGADGLAESKASGDETDKTVFSESRHIPAREQKELECSRTIRGHKVTVKANLIKFYTEPAHKISYRTSKGMVTKVDMPQPARIFVEYQVQLPEDTGWKFKTEKGKAIIYETSTGEVVAVASVKSGEKG